MAVRARRSSMSRRLRRSTGSGTTALRRSQPARLAGDRGLGSAAAQGAQHRDGDVLGVHSGHPVPSGTPDESSVRTALGGAALTLTPESAYSARTEADSPTAANLLALYPTMPGTTSLRHRAMFACPAGEATMLAAGHGRRRPGARRALFATIRDAEGRAPARHRGAGEVWTMPGGDVWWLTPCGCRLS